jgi:hypothetical protein
MAFPSSKSETALVAATDGKRTEQARQWRSARMERFAQTQRRKREWLNSEEIAEVCSELDGSGVPNEAARENAYRNFERDLLSGDFKENGRSRVFYLHPWTVRTRMTPEWLQNAIEYNYDGHRGRSQFLPWCWVPRNIYERWAAKHNLPISPPRFQPEHVDTAVVAQPTASEQPEHVDTAVLAQPTASEKLPQAIAKRRRPAEERIRQELEKKAPEFIDTPGDKTCWSIAQILVETRGSDRKFDLDKTSKALKRYYANRLKD